MPRISTSPVGGGGGGVPSGTKPRFTSTVTPSSRDERGHDVVAGDPVLRTVEDDDLLGQPFTGDGDLAPGRVVRRESRFGEQFVDRHRGLFGPLDDVGVELLALVEASQLPHGEPQHEQDAAEAEQVKRDPFRAQQEPVHLGDEGTRSGPLPSPRMDAEDVTAEWLSTVLGGEVGAVRQDRIGDGLVGMNLRVELVDAAPELPTSVVIKLPSNDPTSRMTGIMLRNYEREVKFYLEVADSVDVRVPHCHHGEWDEASGDFVLVLEDMTPAEQGNQVTGCDVAAAELAVRELARLHGPRWDDPTLADLDWLTRRTGPDDGAQLEAMFAMFFPSFAATYRPYLTDEAFAVAEAFGPLVSRWVLDRESTPLAVTHGDYRLDNLLFGTQRRRAAGDGGRLADTRARHPDRRSRVLLWRRPAARGSSGQRAATARRLCARADGVRRRRRRELAVGAVPPRHVRAA